MSSFSLSCYPVGGFPPLRIGIDDLSTQRIKRDCKVSINSYNTTAHELTFKG